MKMPRREHDVIVIGGGPAGSATALLLARAGFSTLLVEASDYCANRIGETVSPPVKSQMLRMGVPAESHSGLQTPSQGIVSVWGGREHYADFLLGKHGVGWHVDRAVFDQTLADSARKAGATVRSCSRMVTPPRRNRTHWAFEIASPGERVAYRCRFLVDSTGRSGSSPLAPFSPRIVLDRLIAIVWTGRSSRGSPYLTVESISDGWFYAAALPGDQMTIVYMTDSDLYRKGCKHFPDLWRRRLNETKYARERLSSEADLAKLRIVSAASVVRARIAGRNWCAVGDAAFSHDPLSGLGVHHALESATHAAGAIECYLNFGKALRAYESWMARKFNDYVISRRHYYSTEQRWQNSQFWQRRFAQFPQVTNRTGLKGLAIAKGHLVAQLAQ
jgi:flavin-dependent dehydrogenase